MGITVRCGSRSGGLAVVEAWGSGKHKELAREEERKYLRASP